MKKWVIITLLAVGVVSLVASSDAFAFGRRCGIFRGRCSAPVSCGTVCAPVCTTVCAPVVETVTPVFAYPVLVPAFQFQYVPTTYAVPTVPVTGYPQAYPVVQQGFQPAAQPYGYGMQPQPYGYQPYQQQQQQQQQQPYGMQQQPQPQQQQQQFGLSRKDQIRELAKALLEEMNKIADGGTDNGPPAVPQPQQPQGPSTQAPAQPDPQLTQVVFNALGRTCSHCHTGVGAKKEFQIYTQLGHMNQNVNWSKVKDELVKGHMPPKDTQFQLSPFERQSILEWLKQIGVN